MAARKMHGYGGRTGHQAKEAHRLLEHLKKRNQQLLSQSQRRQRKEDKKIVQVIKSLAAPELLKEWARQQQLIARSQLWKRKIRPFARAKFTFYCKLLAMDALFSKHLPKKRIKVGKGLDYKPVERCFLDGTQERNLFEKLNELGASTASIRKEVRKQQNKLRKTLPKTLQKLV